MENGEKIIRIEHLRKRYGDLQVLDDINLTIRKRRGWLFWVPAEAVRVP